MNLQLALIPGDGIGPEVLGAAVRVLDKIAKKFGHTVSYAEVDAGGVSIDKYGKPLADEALQECLRSDSVLLGAVGGPKWDNIPGIRPEQALLGLRGGMKLYANFRPAMLFEQLKQASPLKNEMIANGLDILIVRELTGGIYFGDNGRSEDGNSAYDTERYAKYEIKRLMQRGIDAALSRSKKITVVDKANILETSRLWREVARGMAAQYPALTLEFMYVDNAAMQLVRNPSQFDVIVTSNMFGDILSDEASMLTGSIGMLPSASLGEDKRGMYEPIHGSAPDIAGKNVANPLATILSVAMMFQYSFGRLEEAKAIEAAVNRTLAAGYRTGDILDRGDSSLKLCSTTEMTDAVLENI